jgi:RnfABCDGE-type electron transport complex G subunit
LEEQTKQIGDFTVGVTKVSANGEVVGYAVEAPSITKNGYADRIYLMVGFVEKDGETLINGIKVLSQKEAPGLGANMTKEGNKLELSAVGKNPAEMTFKVKKDDASGSFDSLTGSTISSRAYANAVETAYAGYLKARGWLDEEDASDSASGATSGADAASGATLTEQGDATSGATAIEECNAENNVTEEEK